MTSFKTTCKTLEGNRFFLKKLSFDDDLRSNLVVKHELLKMREEYSDTSNNFHMLYIYQSPPYNQKVTQGQIV